MLQGNDFNGSNITREKVMQKTAKNYRIIVLKM